MIFKMLEIKSIVTEIMNTFGAFMDKPYVWLRKEPVSLKTCQQKLLKLPCKEKKNEQHGTDCP